MKSCKTCARFTDTKCTHADFCGLFEWYIPKTHKSPADLPEAGASAERISSVVRCCQDSEDILKEAVENALYSTGRFTTDQCTDLAEGIIIYIKDSGLKISRQ